MSPKKKIEEQEEEMPWDEADDLPTLAEIDDEPQEIADLEDEATIGTAEVQATTALAVQDKPQKYGIAEYMQIANVAMKAPWMVKDMRSVEEATIKMMYGQELGLGPMFSLRHVYIVQGTPALSAGLVGALIQKSELYDYQVTDLTDERCEIVFKRGFEEIGTSVFTIEDAKTAGIYKAGSGWDKYPRNMLFARALTNGARWYAPGVFNGPIYTPEELRESQISEPAPAYTVSAAGSDSYVVPPTIPTERVPWDEDLEEPKKEMCPKHPGQNFFRGGRMKGYAHPTAPKGVRAPWCDHEDMRVKYLNKVIEEMDEQGFASEEGERANWVYERLEDLKGIPADEWRIQDLIEIDKLLHDHTV